jgi:nicotinamide-nucleotide amidase
MLPVLVRRGRDPRVGINASQATIIFRVTASGPTEEAAQAAAEPVVATIRKCLGDLVFGEEDDELQDAVVRLLRQKGRTLATAEWGTAGLAANWLGELAEGRGFYLGDLVLAGEKSVRQLLDVPADLIARHEQEGKELVAAMAAACRKRFASDYGLAVGPFPKPNPAAAEPKPLFFGLATADSVTTNSVPFAAHPALLRILAGKQALNMVRLAMLK